MEEAEEYQPGSTGEALIPTEQATIEFYGKPLLVVRLSDGRPGVVLRSLTDNLQLDRVGQIRRVQRTEAIADDLIVNVQVQTEGGPQRVHVLAIRAVAYWLATIDAKRVREEIRADIIRYQREAVDVLYSWAQQPRTLPMPAAQQVIEARPGAGGAILAPIEEPGPQAGHAERATYHEIMSVWHRHQADLHAQEWRTEVNARIEDQEARIEAREAITGLIPDILERLGQEKVSIQHQTNIRGLVKRLSELSGTPYQTIYWELAQAFQVPRYDEILESQYAAVQEWFKRRIEQARRPRGKP